MKKIGFTASFFVSLFLSLFLAGIIVFWLVAHLKIYTYELFVPVLVFSVVNLLLLVFVLGTGRFISNKIGVPHYAVIIITTAAYSIVQFVFMAANFKFSGRITKYTLVELVLLFAYCAVVMPISVSGSKKQ